MSVSASVGPVSGIDYGKLITGLTASYQASIDKLGTRIKTLTTQTDAFTSLSALMTSVKVSAANFTSSAIFRAANATAANPSILSATAGIGTTNGNYAFNVQRLASASQQVTQGFSSSDTALGLSGTIKLQLGGGKLDDVAKLSTLNGGAGVARGSIRVTDRSGASTLVDLTEAVDVKDVVNTINSATGVNVLAKLDGDRLVITDNSGGSGTLAITNAGGTTTAADLGLTATASGATLTGATITKLKSTTNLDALNDGLGVRNAGILEDFSLRGSVGTANFSLNGAKTVGDAIGKINAKTSATGITATISSDGLGITLTDSGGGPVVGTALNGSFSLADLGLTSPTLGNTLTGNRIASALSGPLLTNLRGGNEGQAGWTGPKPGTLTVNGETVDLSSAQTLDDVVRTFNTNSQGVTAAINSAGNGITLSSNSASFTVPDGTGNLASFLNVAGTSTATATGSEINSGDERLRYVSNNTLLTTLNGGSGVRLGQIRVSGTNSLGASGTFNIDLSSAKTVGDVVTTLNQYATNLGISARINDTGDGILLTQTAGSNPAKIEDISGGTTAKDLNIAGTFANNTLDGSFQESITVAATDKLSDIATKINNLGANMVASVINDGSGSNGYRLNIASRNAGTNGRVVFDGSAAGITTTSLVNGQDAVLVYGGDSSGKGGLVATNSTNTFTGIVPGLTLTLTGTGATTVTVNRDDQKIKDSVSGFVDAYNKVIDNLADATKFDSSNTANNGPLFGNSTVQQIQDGLGSFLTKTFSGVGKFSSLANVGIKVGQDGKLSLDEDKFAQVLASNPDDVRSLFTTNVKAVTGGPRNFTTGTTLSSLYPGQSFPGGHISVTDGSGANYDIDLTGALTIGQVLTKINTATSGKVTASINNTQDGIALTRNGGTSEITVANGTLSTAADFLKIAGTSSSGLLNKNFLPLLPAAGVQGVGSALSDVLDRYINAQTGLIFKTTDAINTQETQLKSRQTDLASLLVSKKNRMIQQYAMLEVTLSHLQSQGSSLSSLSSTTSSK